MAYIHLQDQEINMKAVCQERYSRKIKVKAASLQPGQQRTAHSCRKSVEDEAGDV